MAKPLGKQVGKVTFYSVECQKRLNNWLIIVGVLDPSKSPLPSHLLPPDEIGLKADDFFSSLELRSSSKKPVQSTSGMCYFLLIILIDIHTFSLII